MDSDFEIKPPPQTGCSQKVHPNLANPSSRKRARSLNEEALNRFSSIKRDQVPTTAKSMQSSHKSSLEPDSISQQASIEVGNMTPSNKSEYTQDAKVVDCPGKSTPCNNICSYDNSVPPPLQKAIMSRSSNLQHDRTELKPHISSDGKGMDRVLEMHHCLDTKSSEHLAIGTDQTGDSSKPKDHQEPPHVPTPEKATRAQDSDYRCHGMHSDFEVSYQTKPGFSQNPDPMLSSSSSKKRPRSLNEAALELFSLRRLDKTPGTGKATNQISLKADSIVDHGIIECESPMESKKIEDIEDVYLIDHISQSTPCKPLRYHINFTSTHVEKEVFKDIIDRIPFSGPRPRVVQIKKNWVDHKMFGLSMRVYGTVSSYVIDVMGKAVMTEEYEKNQANLLPSDFWYRHVVRSDIAALLQNKDADAQDLSKLFIEPNQGYRLDLMSMVFIPVFYYHFWYLVVANFGNGRFEVLIPNQLLQGVESDAETIILNFKRMFNYACPHSTKVHIWQMETVYRSVTNSKNHCDSGVFVMKLIQNHDGESQHLFKPEEAKTLRECLSYYLLTHPDNEKFDSLFDIKKILSIHGINRNSYN